MCAWLTGWSKRKTITITGQAGAGTDYQVDFSIASAAGGDFNLESHCTSFPNDIEVTDNDQTTPLDYWVEDLTVDPIKMWVEVADDLGSNVDIYVYYGKSGASSQSDGEATFSFFDDFSGTYPGTKWTGDTSYGSVSGGIITVAGDTNTRMIYSDVTGGTNTAFRSRLKVSVFDPNNYHWFGYEHSADTDFIEIDISYNNVPNDGFTNYKKASSSSGSLTLSLVSADVLNYAIWEVRRNSITAVETVRNNVQEYNYTDTTYIPTIALNAALASYTSGGNIQCDWVCLRKYQVSEPAFSSAGGEESAPTAGQISIISSPPIALFGGL